MGTAAELLNWAHDQIGVTEAPPGSNHVRYWDDCGLHGFQGQPWCAAFVLAGLTATGTAPVTRSVYVPQIRLDYQHAGRLFPVNDGQPGDQVIYNIGQGHTGIIVSVDRAMRTIRAIEGNTSSDQHGSQDNGGGVFLRTRAWGPIRGVGRPLFTVPTPGVSPMFDPPLQIVAWTLIPGGLVAVGPDGGVFCEPGNLYRGSANGKAYFVGRTPARIETPNSDEAAAGKVYVIVATSGERYAYPERP